MRNASHIGTTLRALAGGLLTVGVLYAAGCAPLRIGRPVPQSAVQRIRPGFTTRDEIIALLGRPLRTVPGETGEIWVYRFLDGHGASQELIVSFSADQVGTFSYR
jgi:outer membrane protein assembly factor BamE (lipoprotein component of BamABCDE complex)